MRIRAAYDAGQDVTLLQWFADLLLAVGEGWALRTIQKVMLVFCSFYFFGLLITITSLVTDIVTSLSIIF